MKVIYCISPRVTNRDLNALFADAWPNHRRKDFQPLLRHALAYVCAHEGKRLIGFAKVIGDGGVHGFLLDPTVALDRQRRGIGRKLIEKCAREASRRGVEWLHVDFEPRLERFYSACRFLSTKAGLRRLKGKSKH